MAFFAELSCCGKSMVATCVRVPDLEPAVRDCLQLLLPPLLCWHRIDVSDAQVVRSHTLPFELATPENDAMPSPDPPMVTLIDPVEAPFVTVAALSRPPAMDSISVELPSRLAADRTAFLLPCEAWAPAASTDVSDCHKVRSAPVCPILALAHGPSNPKLDPRRVTADDPVVTVLALLLVLTMLTSAEAPVDAVLTRQPIVNTARLLPNAPLAT